MRDTPSCLPAATSTVTGQPLKPRYVHFLSLSYHPNHGFVYTTVPGGGQGQGQVQPTAAAPGIVPGPGPVPVTAPAPSIQGQPQIPSVPATTNPATPPQNYNSNPNNANTTNPTPNYNQNNTPMLMTTIPLPSSATLFQHFVHACQPLWCHRHTLVVAGPVYDIADFRIRLGDVRQIQPTARVRGTVVEVEWKGPSLVASVAAQSRRRNDPATAAAAAGGGGGGGEEEDANIGNGNLDLDSLLFDPSVVGEGDVDAEYNAVAGLIRGFYARIGVENAREAILVPDVGKEVKGQLRRLKQGIQNQKGGMINGKPRDRYEADIWDRSYGKPEDPDPEAGVDVARQFMEIFRFNR